MKQNPLKSSTRQQIFDPGPMLTYSQQLKLNKPNPPTPEAVKKAQFVDKTYKWTGR